MNVVPEQVQMKARGGDRFPFLAGPNLFVKQTKRSSCKRAADGHGLLRELGDALRLHPVEDFFWPLLPMIV